MSVLVSVHVCLSLYMCVLVAVCLSLYMCVCLSLYMCMCLPLYMIFIIRQQCTPPYNYVTLLFMFLADVVNNPSILSFRVH